MKKTYLFIIMIFSTFMLVSCDITKKSFQSLDTNYIPNKVTKDFELPRGKYAKFNWTSSNEEVLKIKDSYVTVIQQDEDVLVTVTAEINNRTKDFDIIVLKKGSGLSPYEKALKFMDLYGEINVDQDGIYLLKKIDDLYLLFDDKLIGNNAIPTYTDYGDGIVIDHLDTVYREFNVYFNEMIDGKLVQIHSNKIKIKYQQHKDLFFQLRAFDTYLNEDDYLIIVTNQELEQYINTLNNNDVDAYFLEYLESFRNRNFVSHNYSLLLINVSQPTSNNEVVLKGLKLDGNNLIVDIDTVQGIKESVRNWPFVIEVNKNLNNVEDVIINTNYVLQKENLYLKSYVYNHSYFDELEDKTIIIESFSELEDYIIFLDEQEKDYGLINSYNIYQNHLLTYNEQYFGDKKLVLINYIAGSGSYQYLYKDFELRDNKLQIYLHSNSPFIGTCDVKPWNFIFEASKLLEFNEVSIKFQRNKIDLNPIIKKTLYTIIFADDSYNIDNVYRPIGSLLDHQDLLEIKYNIDFNDEVIIINDKEAFKEIYSILRGEDYNKQENLEGYVWLLVKRLAGGSQYISIDYSLYDQYIGYNYPKGKEAGDTAMFHCLDIIQILRDDYNILYNLNFVNMND